MSNPKDGTRMATNEDYRQLWNEYVGEELRRTVSICKEHFNGGDPMITNIPEEPRGIVFGYNCTPQKETTLQQVNQSYLYMGYLLATIRTGSETRRLMEESVDDETLTRLRLALESVYEQLRKEGR